jgi:hypothetical protein
MSSSLSAGFPVGPLFRPALQAPGFLFAVRRRKHRALKNPRVLKQRGIQFKIVVEVIAAKFEPA